MVQREFITSMISTPKNPLGLVVRANFSHSSQVHPRSFDYPRHLVRKKPLSSPLELVRVVPERHFRLIGMVRRVGGLQTPRHTFYIPHADPKTPRVSSGPFGNLNRRVTFARLLGQNLGTMVFAPTTKGEKREKEAQADEGHDPTPTNAGRGRGEQADMEKDRGTLVSHKSDHQWIPLLAFVHHF